MKQITNIKTKSVLLLFSLLGLSLFAQSIQKSPIARTSQDTLKVATTTSDSLSTNAKYKLKTVKKSARASYYANKFNGKRTASGAKFSNEKLTAAHRKLPFGTIVKVTNEANGKSIFVEINDRGPFSRGREIDLSKRAFMEITANKNSGTLIVTLEIAEKIQTTNQKVLPIKQ